VDLELSEGGVPVTSYRADGLIVATPTGSTAYSMSAGGSIVDPRVSCFCVTPISPHSLAARPMIFPDSATLEIKNICQREKMLYLTVDGRTNYEMYKGDVVRISKSPLRTNLVRIKQCGFYKKLRKKMTENE
jgi:NAD+ kinase